MARALGADIGPVIGQDIGQAVGLVDRQWLLGEWELCLDLDDSL